VVLGGFNITNSYSKTVQSKYMDTMCGGKAFQYDMQPGTFPYI